MRKLVAVLGVVSIVAGAGAASGGAKQRFTAKVDNPWFPLVPGTTFIYRGTKDAKRMRDVVTVTHRTRTIAGAPCVVVRDLSYLNGRLEERTTDWYSQDAKGNVWYFGEDTAELDRNGHVKDRSGTWLAGRDGAKAGIYMPAHPRVGQSGRQEYYKGEAEDHFRVVSLRASVKVPYMTSHAALLTEEWTPLEPGVLDHKYYVRGIGTVREQSVRGPLERLELVSLMRPG